MFVSLKKLLCISFFFLFFGTSVMAVSTPVTITDNTDPLATSTATFDPNSGLLTSWTFNDPNNPTSQLNHVGAHGIGLYYRLDNTGPAIPLTQNATLTSIDDFNSVPSTNDPTSLTAHYLVSGLFTVDVEYDIIAAGTDFTHINSTIQFHSVATAAHAISIFAFSDLDLNQTPVDDSVSIPDSAIPGAADNTAGQVDGLTSTDEGIQAGNGSQTVNPSEFLPNFWEADTASNLWNFFGEANPVSLNDNDGTGLTNDDFATAFQFNDTLDSPFLQTDQTGTFYTIQREITLTDQGFIPVGSPPPPGSIPEPSIAVLAGLGLAVLSARLLCVCQDGRARECGRVGIPIAPMEQDRPCKRTL